MTSPNTSPQQPERDFHQEVDRWLEKNGLNREAFQDLITDPIKSTRLSIALLELIREEESESTPGLEDDPHLEQLKRDVVPHLQLNIISKLQQEMECSLIEAIGEAKKRGLFVDQGECEAVKEHYQAGPLSHAQLTELILACPKEIHVFPQHRYPVHDQFLVYKTSDGEVVDFYSSPSGGYSISEEQLKID